jgi:hypothetical protein
LFFASGGLWVSSIVCFYSYTLASIDKKGFFVRLFYLTNYTGDFSLLLQFLGKDYLITGRITSFLFWLKYIWQFLCALNRLCGKFYDLKFA